MKSKFFSENVKQFAWDLVKKGSQFSKRCLNSFFCKTEEFWTAFVVWKGNDQVLFYFRPYQLFAVFDISARVFKNLNGEPNGERRTERNRAVADIKNP